MRAVRFTKAEDRWLRDLVDHAISRLPTGDFVFGEVKVAYAEKVARSVLTKLEAAGEPKKAGVNAGAFEAALIGASAGKVVPVDGSAYARVSRQATAIGATPELGAVVGQWMAAQRWLSGPFTVFTVLNKWPDWLARARATQAPDLTGTGNLGQGPGPKRAATAAGRRPSGLG